MTAPADRIAARLRERLGEGWEVRVSATGRSIVVRAAAFTAAIVHMPFRMWKTKAGPESPDNAGGELHYSGRDWCESLADDLADALLVPSYPLLSWSDGRVRLPGGAPTDVAVERVRAGESVDAVAADYGVAREAVEQAVALWERG